MFLKLLGVIFSAIAILGVAVFFGIVLLLMLRFWVFAAIVLLFLGILYALARLVGLQIDFYPN